MSRLLLADELSLPVDVVTQTIAVLAKRRAGKSYLMRRLVEQLFNASQQVVLVDPKGDQWGIRSAADGKGAGLSVVILGGERADVPLEANAGEVVAKLVVEERVSALLDLSLFRKHEVATFMTGFLENLYRLKAREIYRTPMMLVMDEADAVAPQKPQKGEERMLGAAEDIVRRGGQRGIGCVLVTQRSAVLNKNLLTQAQVLITLRTIAPQDLAAMNAWIDVHGTVEQRQTLMESLPSLPVGDAWIWSPGWPTVDGIFKRIHVLPIETFDSGATPKPGEKRSEPKTVAEVDLDALKRQMAATIEKAKADDPRLLRQQIAELKREVVKREPAEGKKIVEIPIIAPKVAQRIERALSSLGNLVLEAKSIDEKLIAHGRRMSEAWDTMNEVCSATVKALQSVTSGKPLARAPVLSLPSRQRVGTNGSGSRDPEVGRGGLYRILVALAQRPQGLNQRQLGLRATLSSRSGSFATYLSKARANGWIEGSGELRITDAGIKALGHYDPLPEGRDLLQHWLGELGGSGASRILRVLADAYPKALSQEAVGVAANLSDRSGSFATYLSRLRGLELVTGRGELRASEELFD